MAVLRLEERLISDLRLLANGSFAPLDGFMDSADYASVLKNGRLRNGQLFPIPIVLPADETLATESLQAGTLILKDDENQLLAQCEVLSIYEPRLEEECLATLGTTDPNHPSVKWIQSRAGKLYIGGKITPLPALMALDQEEGILSAAETKAYFKSKNWKTVVAFQTRNPLHRAHLALIENSLSQVDPNAALFLNPVIGPTQEGDVEASARMQCYQALLPHFGNRPIHLGYLPLAMRMAGPKEALLHALIRKNHGATHFIIGRDHAGPSTKTTDGKPFYTPYAAQTLVQSHAKELGLGLVTSEEMVFVQEEQRYLPENLLAKGQTPLRISGTEIRYKLRANQELPAWFSFPKVEEILRSYYQRKSGLCLYLTGLPCSGKSTQTRLLKRKIESIDPLQREVIILDGDVVRNYLSSDLGFSKKDRSTHVRRMGYVASLIVASGGICLCANIAPYEEDRQANRTLIQSKGQYFEIYVDTPLEQCEARDVKGLYRLAREGKIKEFTGVSDPYEIPSHPELVVNGALPAATCVDTILEKVAEVYPLLKKSV